MVLDYFGFCFNVVNFSNAAKVSFVYLLRFVWVLFSSSIFKFLVLYVNISYLERLVYFTVKNFFSGQCPYDFN